MPPSSTGNPGERKPRDLQFHGPFPGNVFRQQPSGEICGSLSAFSHRSLENHGCRVHAVAQISWRRAIVKNVSEVRVTPGARHGRPHAETPVFQLHNIFPRDRLPEARPARTRVELGLRRKKRRTTANATIDPLLVKIPVGTGVSHFGISSAGDIKRIGGELSSPLHLALDDFLYTDRTGRRPGRRKFGNRNLRSRPAGRRG
jgi:hypothetical protein